MVVKITVLESRYLQPEDFAYFHLVPNKRSDKLHLPLMLDTSYGPHFGQHGFR